MERTDRLKNTAWRLLFGAENPPESEGALVHRIYLSAKFGGQEDSADQATMVRHILERCGETVEEDLEEYFFEGRLTAIFYDSLASFLDDSDSPEEGGGNGAADDDDDDDDEGADQYSPVDASPKMYGLDLLYNMVRNDLLDLNPPWQRTMVWSPKKQRELIKSILLGIPLPSIILHQTGDPGTMNERFSIIDGKQRLTAIYRFLQNEFKLPSFDVGPDHPLFLCKNRWYDDPRRPNRSLAPRFRNRIMMAQIPVLLFREVPERRLRQIFNLYNVSATRLNAAEIRNAIYQNNPIHQALFILSGEAGEDSLLPYVDSTIQTHFRHTLRSVLPSTKRFATLDFLCRYLGFSRAPTEDGRQFGSISTSKAINRYFDLCSERESVQATVKEIIRVFDKAQDYFDLDDLGDHGHRAFYTTHTGSTKFQALQAITNMVCARMLDRVEALQAATRQQIDNAIRQMLEEVEYPDKQQYTTIWSYQANCYLGLVEALGLDLHAFDGGRHRVFGERMARVRMIPL